MIPKFDKKYKIVITHEWDESSNYEKLSWANLNSNGAVDVKTTVYRNIYFAFENEDDATFFKIKYGS